MLPPASKDLPIQADGDINVIDRSTFVPPSGLKRAAGDDTLEEFDLVSLKDKLDRGCQLWAIRLPTGVSRRARCPRLLSS